MNNTHSFGLILATLYGRPIMLLGQKSAITGSSMTARNARQALTSVVEALQLEPCIQQYARFAQS